MMDIIRLILKIISYAILGYIGVWVAIVLLVQIIA